MTPRQIFVAVCNHLGQQGKRCDDGSGGCMYRGPRGLKCAVGALIPDSMYDVEMDDYAMTVPQLIEAANRPDNPLTLPNYFRDNAGLLAELQAAHDCSRNWETPERDMRAALEYVAERYRIVRVEAVIIDCVAAIKGHQRDEAEAAKPA